MPTRSGIFTDLAPAAENDVAWKNLPPLEFANRFHGLKDRTVVLARSDEGSELLVAGQYGDGRVLAFAGDSTWKWWPYGFESEHKRFWRQTILWLAREDIVENDKVWIRLPQRRFNPAASVQFTTGATTARGNPVQDATFQAEVIFPDATRRSIRLTSSGDTLNGTLKAPRDAGEYTIKVTAMRDGKPIPDASENFEVLDWDLELSDPAAGPTLMANLATMTTDAGGRALAAEELPALLNEIKKTPPELEVEVQSRWQLGDSATNAWPFFLFVVCVLGGEMVLAEEVGIGLTGAD